MLTQVPKRHWKPAGMSLSVIGMGCGRLGALTNLTPVSEQKRTLAQALECGINLFDTANVYGQGDSERIVGEIVRGRRDHVFVITKIGMRVSSDGGLGARLKPLLRAAARSSSLVRNKLLQTRHRVVQHDFAIKRMPKAVDDCLGRLRFEAIDALLLHDPPLEVLRNPAIAAFLADCKASGKIRHYGISACTIEEVEAALGIDGLEVLQMDAQLAARLSGLPAQQIIREREIALFVRQILRPPGVDQSQPPLSPETAITAALGLPSATSAIIGLSTPAHLEKAIGTLR